MKDIALAIMVVGLCFYEGYLKVNDQRPDVVASMAAVIGAIILLIN